MKRLISVFLALLLLFTGISVTNNAVYAQDEETAETIESIETVEEERHEEPAVVEETADQTAPDETAEAFEEGQETIEDEELLPFEEDPKAQEETGEIQAEPSSTGDAYAILTGEGELVFFRSSEVLAAGDQTLTIHEKTYSGYVYTGVENTGYDVPWATRKSDIVKAYALDVIRPVKMRSWFSSAVNFVSFDTANLDASAVTDMGFMFLGCTSLQELDLSGLDTSSVTGMSNLFSNCTGLKELELGNGFIKAGVTALDNMFGNCSSLVSIDLSGSDTSGATTMRTMFSGCGALKSIDLSSFDTGNVTDMIAMFSGCSSLKELDLSSFDTEGVIGMHSMFYGCTSLESLDLSSFDLRSIGDDTLDNGMKSMFTNCHMLSSVKLGTGWSQWKHDAKLPAGSWKHATVGIKTETELYDGYVANRETWAGEWVREHQAYAVLEDDGDLIFTRSFEVHETGEGTLTDRKGNTYSGYIYANIENGNSPWGDRRGSIKTVSAVDMISFGTQMPKFNGFTELTAFDGKNFDTSQVTDMAILFSGCEKLETVDLTGWNTGNVTLMYEMFRGCTKLKTLDLSSFNTEKVTTMSQMFYICNSLESIDLSNFDTSNVTNMGSMFGFDYVLSELDVSHFDTSNVTKMNDMFSSCKKLSSLDVSSFYTSKVTTMSAMFADMPELTAIDLSGFDTSTVTAMSWMFHNDSKLSSIVFGDDFDTSNITDMQCMFTNCSSLETLDLSNFNTANVTNMSSIFSGCLNLTSVKLGKGWTTWKDDAPLPTGSWANASGDVRLNEKELQQQYPVNADIWAGEWRRESAYAVLMSDGTLIFTRSQQIFNNATMGTLTDIYGDTYYGRIFAGVERTLYSDVMPWSSYKHDIKHVTAVVKIYPTNMYKWFEGCSELISFNSLNFDTSRTESMIEMFCDCTKLEDVDLSFFDTANVDSFNGMFRSCESLERLDLSSFDTGKVWDMEAMFYMCYKLKDLDISSFDTSNVERMSAMFSRCYELEKLDLSHFETGKVETMYDMFEECYALKDLDISSFDTSKVQYMWSMFDSCSSLERLELSHFDTSCVESMNRLFRNCSELKYLDISSFDTSNCSSANEMFTGLDKLETVVLSSKITDLSSFGALSGHWTNGSEYLESTDLASRYAENAAEWAGTWTRTELDAYGQILPIDQTVLPEYIPDGLWIAGVKDEPYTGKAIIQDFRVYDHKTLLTAGKDYIFKYANNTKAGTASLTVTGKGNYQGTLKKEFTILPLELNETNTVVTLSKDTFAYNGKVQKPKVTSVVYNGKKLKANTDYSVKYWTPESKEAPYEYNIEIIGKGNYYSEYFYAKYVITDLIPVNTLTVSGLKDHPYTGTAINAYDLPLVIKKGKEVIYDKVNGINEGHVSLYVENGTDVGTASLIIQGSTGYAGRIVKTFKITGTALSKAKISGINPSYEFTGSEWTPIAVLTVNGTNLNGKEVHEYADLPDSEKRTYDYTYEYKDNLDIGTATVLFDGVNGYTGSLKKTFKITGTTLTAKNVTADGLGPYDYKGEAIEPKEPQVQLKYGGANLFEGLDYEIVSYKNNDKAGTATVTYKGIGRYTGTFNKTFKINKAKLDGAAVTLVSKYGYTKGGAKPEPEVTVDGHKLVSGKDYTLTYKNNTKPGTATLTIKGKGNYEGTLTRTFEVTKRRLTSANMTVNDKVYAGKAVAMSTAVTITDVNGKKLKAGTDYDKTIRYTYADDTVVYDTSVNPSQPVTRRAGSEVLKTDFIDPLTRIKAEATLKGNYVGTISKIFRIVYFDVAKAKVTISQQYYKGTQIYPKKQDLVIMADGFRLTDDDYEIVSCENNLTAGKASITIKGVGRCGGTKTISFTIAKRSLGMTIKFHPNGATSGNVKDLLIYKDTKLNKNSYKKVVAVGTEIKTYRFNGWNTRYDGLGIHYDERAVYTYEPEKAGSFVILYAEWIEE